MKLYRILRKTTHSLQPGSESCTFWQTEVLYCGYDRAEALRIYYESEPTDYYRGHGGACAKTVKQAKEIAATV